MPLNASLERRADRRAGHAPRPKRLGEMRETMPRAEMYAKQYLATAQEAKNRSRSEHDDQSSEKSVRMSGGVLLGCLCFVLDCVWMCFFVVVCEALLRFSWVLHFAVSLFWLFVSDFSPWGELLFLLCLSACCVAFWVSYWCVPSFVVRVDCSVWSV